MALRLTTGLFSCGLMIASVALAQSGQVISRQMDDQEPQVLHFSMPDFVELRQPDFVQRDLPTFVEELVLSTEQTSVVERAIDDYLEQFKKLIDEHFPKGSGPMRIALGGGDDGEKPGIMMIGPGEEFEGLGEALEGELDGEMPHELNMDVNVRIGGPGPDEEAEALPEGGVAIKIATPDGEELSPEMRAKLEEAAAKLAEQMRAKIEKQMQEGGEQGLIPPGGAMSIEDIQKRQAEMAAKTEIIRSAKAELRQTFVTNMQTTLLTEEQLMRWPALERTLRREKTLPKGRLSGERTDLVRLLKQLELPESRSTNLETNLEAYELALDNALRQRNEFVPSAESKINQALQDGDADKALTLVDRATALRLAVRSVNEQFAQTFASSLSEEDAARFTEMYQRTSFPQVYRTTYAQKLFASVKKIEGIDPKTLESIQSLEDAYTVSLNEHNANLRQTLLRHEPAEPRKKMEKVERIVVNHEHPMDVLDESEDQDPIRTAFAKRRDLDDQYARLIQSMLSPEQVAQLPKPPSRKRMEPVIIKMPVEKQG